MMNRITTNGWKEFLISELFETQNSGKQVPTGASVDITKLKDGTVPRISVTGINNGILGYFSSNDKNYRVYENFISVSFLGTVFYHSYKASLDMKVHCLKPIDVKLNKYLGLYLSTIIRNTISNISYSDQISSTSLVKMKIKLPVTHLGKPDWKYMENYIINLESNVEMMLDDLQLLETLKSKKIGLKDWKRFHLYEDDMFEIKAGTKFDRVKMSEKCPSVNFVGRANANNGVTAFIDAIEGIEPYDAGNLTISLGGEYLGSCFIQRIPFYTSQNVNVLIPKWDMPDACKKFIATMIFKEGRTYYKAFIDELNRHIKTDFSIYLPVDSNGRPDWKYMEDYINQIESSVESSMYSLQKVINNVL